ncbi:MAG TPA: hypothetical protein VNU19_10810, partial [Candidatus Acidoferrum sp.]|nr:hypothetical protein [Candidatus Acidoferrum sp.]
MAEPGHTVSTSVGAAGGELSAVSSAGATLTLEVPAGALLSSHALTLTPLQSVQGIPLRGGLLAGAQLGPDGLMLAKPATLTIKLASAPPSGLTAYGFAYEAGGQEFHLVPSHDAPTTITLQVWHFSGAGVGAGTPGDASAVATNHAPSSPVDQAEQAAAAQENVVATLTVLYATVSTQLGTEPPNLPLLDTLFWEALALEPLAIAAGRIDLVQALYMQIGTVLGTAAEIAAGKCVTDHDPSEGARILRWAAWASGHPQVLATLPLA